MNWKITLLGIVIIATGCTKFKPEVYIAEPQEGNTFYQTEEVHIEVNVDGRGVEQYEVKIIDNFNDSLMYSSSGAIESLPTQVHEHFVNENGRTSELTFELTLKGTTGMVHEESFIFFSDSAVLADQRQTHDHSTHQH